MIVIKIERSKEATIITANGHALYNPGNDIVCSAVSCLMYTLIGYLANSDIESQYNIDSGNAKVIIKGNAEECVKMITVGFLQLEKRYPKNVKVVLT